MRNLVEVYMDSPEMVAIVATGYLVGAAMLIVAIWRSEYRPLITRGVSLTCLGGAACYHYVLVHRAATATGEAVEVALLDLPVVIIYVFLCWVTVRSVGQQSPILRTLLLSAVAVIPISWFVGLYSAWRWPPPLVFGNAEDFSPLPASALLAKLQLVPTAFYMVVLAAVFWNQARQPAVPVVKRRVQMSLLAVGALCFFAIPLNTATQHIARVLGGAEVPELIQRLQVVQSITVAAAAFTFCFAWAIQGTKTTRDKALELTLRLVEYRHDVEAYLLRGFDREPGSSLYGRYLDHAASDGAGLELDEDSRLKALNALKLSVMAAREEQGKVLVGNLKRVQRKILEDKEIASRTIVGSRNGSGTDLAHDPLYECLDLALELGTSDKLPHSYLGEPEWRQLAVAAFGDYASQVGLVSHATGKRLLDVSVAGYISGTYRDARDYLNGDEEQYA